MEGRRSEDAPSVRQDAIRRAVPGDRALEGRVDVRGARRAQRHEAYETAAAVVDYAEDPDRQAAEHPDQGEVRSPELVGLGDVDGGRGPTAVVLEIGDELAVAEEDLADGLTCRREADHTLDEATELSGPEVWSVDVKAHDPFLDVGRCSVRSAPATDRALDVSTTGGA